MNGAMKQEVMKDEDKRLLLMMLLLLLLLLLLCYSSSSSSSVLVLCSHLVIPSFVVPEPPEPSLFPVLCAFITYTLIKTTITNHPVVLTIYLVNFVTIVLV